MPSGLLPALELDGELYTESDLIMQILEERFPEKPLMPAKGSPAYHRAQKLMRLERQLFGVWLQWLCRSWYVQQHMLCLMLYLIYHGDVCHAPLDCVRCIVNIAA